MACSSKDQGHSLSEIYPDQYKSLGDLTELDSFGVNHLFQVQDASGCLQSAITKLLLCSNSTSPYLEVRQARDALTRWLQLNTEQTT